MPGKRLPKETSLRPKAARLRRNATRQENHLWYDFLRAYPVRFNRQRIVGAYILDFYCARAKLAVELDGSQHFEPEGERKDAIRSAYLNQLGVHVLRFPNSDVDRHFEGVCQTIDLAVRGRMRGTGEILSQPSADSSF